MDMAAVAQAATATKARAMTPRGERVIKSLVVERVGTRENAAYAAFLHRPFRCMGAQANDYAQDD